MSHGKHGSTAIILTLLVSLGLMTFITPAAQANWLYLENAPVEVIRHTEDVTLLVEGVNVQVLCKNIQGENVLLEEGNATTAPASGTVLFSECTGVEKSTGKEQKNCNPINQPIKATGKAKIVLHTNGQNYFLFEPETGKSFTLVEFSELCALVETNKVTGSFVGECGELNGLNEFVQEDCKNYQVTHLLHQAPEALFPSDVLKFGAHKASIDGIAAATLTGAFKGDSWSGEV